MPDANERLVRCFSAVFPNLLQDEIPAAAMSSVQGWDSLTTIRLLTVIEDEFDVRFMPDDVERLSSFTAISGFLEGCAGK